MKSAKTRKRAGRILIFTLKLLVGIIMFSPIIWVSTGSFKTLTEFTTSSELLPQKGTLENFKYIFYKRTLFAAFPNKKASVFSTSFCFWRSYPMM